MEPISSFAISIVASIAFDFYKGYKSQYDKEIKDTFEKSIDKWAPFDKKIGNDKRTYLKHELSKIYDNPYFEYDTLESELRTFIEIFEKVLAQYQTAYSYIKEIRDANRYNQEIRILKKIDNGIDDIKQDVADIKSELLSNNSSTRKITKSKLEEKDRKSFIFDLVINEKLLNREYNKENSKVDYGYLFAENNNDKSLLEIIKNKSKIIILGNPGLGKTTELEQLAVEIWEDKNNEYVPIYKNLKNFTTTNTIESYLIVDFKQIDKVIYIFDGIDEIGDIHDFTSKLQQFISKLEVNNGNSKFVLSCRTNVYDSSVKNIPDFTIYFLTELTDFEGVKLLNTLSGKQISLGDIDPNFNVFLRNPFQINIAAEYIKSKGKIPTNTSDLWAIYIDNRLNVDEGDKLLKKKFDPIFIKNYSKKLSLINELMKTYVFSENNLYKIFEEDDQKFRKFLNNPLIEKQREVKEWFFEHRNIQEYFAALALSELEFYEIIKFIEIQGTRKTHPSLFNTISFLINLVDNIDDKFNNLIDWIIENEPELLFNIDTDRINIEIKEMVFKLYFEREVIEKTYWISNNGTYSIEKIARFADSSENFDYLFKIINNNENQFRVLASAIELLSYFTIPYVKKESLKKYILKNLKSQEIIPLIKNRILYLVKDQHFLMTDESFINAIFKIFKSETNKEINNGLLNLLFEIDDINTYSAYIKEEFLRAYNVNPRDEKDEVHRGNSMNAFNLFLKLDSETIFKDIAILIFDDKINDFHIEHDFERYIDRCEYFVNQNKELIISILDSLENFSFYKYEKKLLQIINKTQTKDIVVKYLLEKKEFSDVRYFLAKLVDNDNVESIASIVYKNKIDAKEIEFFRNVIANTNNRDLAEIFHQLMEEKGIKFKEEIFTNKKQKAAEEEFKIRVQDHLNILFKKPKLLEEINKIFIENRVELSWTDISEIERNWYKENGHGNTLINSPLQLIRRNLYERNGKVNFEKIKSILEDDNLLYFEIEETLKNYKQRGWIYKFKDSQKENIKKWTLEAAENFDCNNIVIINDKDQLYYNQRNYRFFNTILYFSEELDFSLPKRFLLNCLKVYKFNDNSNIDNEFEEYKKKINDDALFNKQIEQNLKTSKMFPASTARHINYALDYKLKNTYLNIREYLKADNKLNYKSCNILEKYIVLTNDYDFLIEFSNNPDDFYFWCGIKLLLDANKHHDYCKEKSLKYLDSGKENYQKKAIGVLFIQNDIQAINKIIESYADGKYLQISEADIEYYNSIEDFSVIKELYDIAYNDLDRFNAYEYIQFLKKYLYNISEDKVSFQKIRKILEEIKLKLKEGKKDLFHINWLIDDVSKSYINSLSKSYSFRNAFKKMKEISL